MEKAKNHIINFKGIRYVLKSIEIYNDVEVMKQKSEDYYIAMPKNDTMVVSEEVIQELRERYRHIYIAYYSPDDKYRTLTVECFKEGFERITMYTSWSSIEELLRHLYDESVFSIDEDEDYEDEDYEEDDEFE